jgi:Zn-dependent protease
MRRGFLTVARLHGAPVRLHWSLPLAAFLFGGLELQPGRWLAFLVLVLAHELGHALLAWRYRLKVEAIDLHGLGGTCLVDGSATSRQRAVIAWGGVLAQGVLLALATALLGIFGRPDQPLARGFLVDGLVGINFQLALINLLPVAPLDGAEAWALFGRLARARRRERARAARRVVRAADRDEPPPDEVNRLLQQTLDEARRRSRDELN